MMKKLIIATTILLSTLLATGASYATTCPEGKKELIGKLDVIHLNNDDFYPTFTLDTYPDNYLRLSYDHGLNTPYGRAMFALALYAHSSNLTVKAMCSDDGRVNRIYILH